MIERYELEIFTPPCEPGAERFSAKAHLETDISPVFPYLNAVLGGAIYHRQANAITWKKAGHNVAFHPYEIATSNVKDKDAALKEIEGLVELVNRTWKRRDEIQPSYETRQRPVPMKVFSFLPRTNCKECGEPTCYTFAVKLCAGQKSLADCPPLHRPEYATQLAELQRMIPDMPAIG